MAENSIRSHFLCVLVSLGLHKAGLQDSVHKCGQSLDIGCGRTGFVMPALRSFIHKKKDLSWIHVGRDMGELD